MMLHNRDEFRALNYLLRRRRVRPAPVDLTDTPDLAHVFDPLRPLPDWITFTRASVATYVDKFGVVRTAANDTARFDHDPTTLAFIGLRREGSRVNRIFPSANFVGGSNWSAVNASAINGRGAGPDRASSAVEIITSGEGGMQRGSLSVTVSQVTVASCWFKWIAGPTQLALVIGQNAFGGAGGDRALVFDGATGAFVSSHANITSYRVQKFHNGWWRVSAIFTPTAGVVTATVGIYANQSGTTFQAWGADLGPTTAFDSHVPTVSASVTRAAEALTLTGSALTILQGAARSALVEAFFDAPPTGTTHLIGGTYAPIFVTTAPLISSTNAASGGVTITVGAPPIGVPFRVCVAGDATGRILTSQNGVTNAPTAFASMASASLLTQGSAYVRRVELLSRRLSTDEVQSAVQL